MHYAYKAYVTVNKSTISVVITKVRGIIAGCTEFVFDREFGKSQFPRTAALKRPLHLLLDSYPKEVRAMAFRVQHLFYES